MFLRCYQRANVPHVAVIPGVLMAQIARLALLLAVDTSTQRPGKAGTLDGLLNGSGCIVRMLLSGSGGCVQMCQGERAINGAEGPERRVRRPGVELYLLRLRARI